MGVILLFLVNKLKKNARNLKVQFQSYQVFFNGGTKWSAKNYKSFFKKKERNPQHYSISQYYSSGNTAKYLLLHFNSMDVSLL